MRSTTSHASAAETTPPPAPKPGRAAFLATVFAFDWRALVAWSLGGSALTLFYRALRPPVGPYDWIVYFMRLPVAGYPPWLTPLLQPISSLQWFDGFSILSGFSWMALAIVTYRQAPSRDRAWGAIAVAMAIASGPVWILQGMGGVDLLQLAGMIAVPLGIPILTIKPTVAGWFLLSRWRWLAILLIFLGVTVLIWGWWPPSVFDKLDLEHRTVAQGSVVFLGNEAAMGWQQLGLHVAALGGILLFFTGSDPLRLMAAGSLLSPYVMPYHYAVLLPALGRLKGIRQLVIWFLFFFSAVVFGIPTLLVKHLALLIPISIWLALARDDDYSLDHPIPWFRHQLQRVLIQPLRARMEQGFALRPGPKV